MRGGGGSKCVIRSCEIVLVFLDAVQSVENTRVGERQQLRRLVTQEVDEARPIHPTYFGRCFDVEPLVEEQNGRFLKADESIAALYPSVVTSKINPRRRKIPAARR